MSGVAELSSAYLSEVNSTTIPVGYKQTEIGIIPIDWEVRTLEQLVAFRNGAAHENCIDDSGDYVVVNSKFISTEGLIKKGSKECRQPAYQSELLMVMSDVPNGRAIAKCYLVESNDTYTVNQRICALKSIAIEARFLFYKLNRNPFYLAFDDGAKQTNLRRQDVLDCPIPVPPKAEQTAIANALSDVDALISELEKLIAKKQAIKTATMQQLLTGRTRLPQFALRENGTPTNSPGTNLDAGAGGPKGEGQDGLRKSTKPSELGEIPEDWEVVAMGDLGSTYGGLSGKSKQDFGHGNSLYVPFTNVMANVVVDVDNLEKVDVREAQNNLALGDLLFNGSSETPEEVCFSALVSADIRKLYLNSFCFGFRSNQKNAYLPLYLAYWFRSEVGRAAVLVMAQGSTRYNISKSQFMKLTIVLPDTEEQTAIATILSDMDAEIQALEQRLGKTRQIKQGMMQELLTGKTRLIKPSKEVTHE